MIKWISVKDRLPLCSGRYLVYRPHYCGTGLVTICYFDDTDTWYDDDSVNFEKVLSEDDVSHWMPLPEPWRAKNND